ncbi:hypothetical protein FLAN108750_12610 [Flavobacterium antarcticum]|uniref:hypothetical protein n=1 Tax=Flavobacterium antarcticum TaxID=271155 RepID=UPI0003B59F21|nr:hypothetical protein [Flavobacterium antarcticum]
MKKVGITTVFAFLFLIACGKKEADLKADFMHDFKLDLSEMNIDFSQPYVQTYNSEMQRDSIINELAEELTASVNKGDASEQTDTINAIITVSKESSTITAQLKETEDFSNWQDLGVCSDAESFNSKMNEIISENPSAEFGVIRNLHSTQINLYYKK